MKGIEPTEQEKLFFDDFIHLCRVNSNLYLIIEFNNVTTEFKFRDQIRDQYNVNKTKMAQYSLFQVKTVTIM